jgi:hypothetical protein
VAAPSPRQTLLFCANKHKGPGLAQKNFASVKEKKQLRGDICDAPSGWKVSDK